MKQKLNSLWRMLRIKVSHGLTYSLLSHSLAPTPYQRFLLRLLRLYKPKLRILPLQPLSQCVPFATLDNSPASPIWPPQAEEPLASPQQPINLYHFKQAVASAYTSHLIACHPQTGVETLFLETVNGIGSDLANYATGLVVNHNQQQALVNADSFSPKSLHFRHVLLLGGNAAGNYYHWLLEILSQLPWLQTITHQLPANTVWVLPQACADLPSYRDSLACLAPKLAQQAVYIGAGQQVCADNLYRLNSPNALVFNLRTKLLNANFFRFHAASLQQIRQRVLASLQPALSVAEPLPKRVFLARKPNLRRLYNQAEVEGCLQAFGFTTLYPETLSFAQQVQLFQQAEIIVGASGAAWSNLLFARTGLKALSWLPENFMGFAAFSSLAHYHGCQMQIMPVKAHLPNFAQSGYWVNLTQLQQQLERLL